MTQAPMWATSTVTTFRGAPVPSGACVAPNGGAPDHQLPSTLEELRELAEDFAHMEYQQGPGQNARMGYTADIEENKRRKKKKSAYITRFRQKHYENLLERRVAVSEMEMRVACEMRRDLQGCNGQLKEQLRLLERMVGMQDTEIKREVGVADGNAVGHAGNAEAVVADVVATEEAADLANVVTDCGFETATSTECDGDTADSGWMRDLTSGADTDVETQTSDGSASLSSMHTAQDTVTSVFGSQSLYSKPSYEDFMMDDHNPQLFNSDVSNLLATLTKAA